MNAATTSTKTAVKCWSCGAATSGAHFCAACGKIQPLAQGMDYFEVFGLPQKLRIDTAELEKRFHQLSWKLHPDNFVRATEKEREISLALSSELNDAYRALREPLSRVEYLLAHSGMRKEGAHKQQAPPELLEEVFELNMALEEMRGGDDSARPQLEQAEKNFTSMLVASDQELAALFAKYDTAHSRDTLSQIRNVLNRRKYVQNLVSEVERTLAPNPQPLIPT